MIDLRTLQRALGGDISNGQLLCPGPGHSPADRSLSIKLDSNTPDGFVVHSFAGDDPVKCKDFVREKAGLPAFVPKANKGNGNGKTWTFISEHIYRIETGEPYLRVRKYRDEKNKKQYPQAHWHDGQWVKGKPPGAKIPYWLPELIAAAPTTQIFFTEGEKDADALAALGFVATTASEGAAAEWDDALTRYFKDRHVVILPHADVPGRKHAQKVAKAINGVAASVRVLDLYPDRQDGSDVSNWIESDPAGSKLAALAKAAPLWEPPSPKDDAKDKSKGKSDEDDATIAALAALPKLAYEKQREEAAKQLSIRVSILDKLVAAARRDRDGDDDDADDQGKKQADVLIALARDATLFHTPARDYYADIVVNGCRETHKVRSKAFRAWLGYRYFKELKSAPSSEAMQAALNVIEAHALFEGEEMLVHVRVAEHDGKLYLDLADDQWRAIEIDAYGWRVIAAPPVRFRARFLFDSDLIARVPRMPLSRLTRKRGLSRTPARFKPDGSKRPSMAASVF